jgi:hypothetical protein
MYFQLSALYFRKAPLLTRRRFLYEYSLSETKLNGLCFIKFLISNFVLQNLHNKIFYYFQIAFCGLTDTNLSGSSVIFVVEIFCPFINSSITSLIFGEDKNKGSL